MFIPTVYHNIYKVNKYICIINCILSVIFSRLQDACHAYIVNSLLCDSWDKLKCFLTWLNCGMMMMQRREGGLSAVMTARALLESSEITNGAKRASLEGSSTRLEACEKNPGQRQTARHNEVFSTLDSSLRLYLWDGGELLR